MVIGTTLLLQNEGKISQLIMTRVLRRWTSLLGRGITLECHHGHCWGAHRRGLWRGGYVRQYRRHGSSHAYAPARGLVWLGGGPSCGSAAGLCWGNTVVGD